MHVALALAMAHYTFICFQNGHVSKFLERRRSACLARDDQVSECRTSNIASKLTPFHGALNI